MIIEHALLQVRPGEEAAFEAAMAKAHPLIAASPGFDSIEIRKSLSEPNQYLLLVHWDSVESHRDGFRASDRYQEWRALLHKYYDPMPEVSYFGEAI